MRTVQGQNTDSHIVLYETNVFVGITRECFVRWTGMSPWYFVYG